jgi:hypothetical protein
MLQDESPLKDVCVQGLAGNRYFEISPGKVFVNGEERKDIQSAALTVEEAEAQGMFKAVDFPEPETSLRHAVRHMHAHAGGDDERCCHKPYCCWVPPSNPDVVP